ncbi:hypothetical protein ECG_02125 [Echinococcus granulosus]|uniref:Uncharacterized protein n=1 Tax=Echinococcus granulosus TaxID=6210 RepID=U6JJC0_ECHGR|nr:hypothetical protein EGR_04236 [Echinococcus granulosus]EUB60990.1 hypothetical protein EGR_04236 [Echinococcus granulosus]KAH9285302.1 hypothetical protein ECG_02125 [Echinococcus granulosus]CDS21839.1 hypothetical protein EgrG_000193100 [Echinococcus granulosus]
MTEYDNAYNWEKTWLNAAPMERTSGAKQKLEPHFQHKRHFEQSDSYKLWGPESQAKETAEDPFFVIHGQSHSQIAYPNILYKRSKSAPRQRQNLSPTDAQVRSPQRPKSDRLVEVKKPVKQNHKKHHLKPRTRSKGKKTIESWPELKLDIPLDSPQPTPPKRSEYQRSFSPPPAYIYGQNRPHSAKNQADTKRKEISENMQTKSEPEKRPTYVSSSPLRTKESVQAPQSKQDDSKLKPHRRRLQSEYQANYKNLSDYTSVVKLHNDEAKQNQQQVEGCHFSRKYFNQLESANVNLWDPPSSSRSEIVGLDPALRAKRLKEYKIPPTRSRLDTSLSDSLFKLPRQSLHLPFKYSVSSPTARYEPSKYSHQPLKTGEPKVKVLSLEKMDDLTCTPEHHICNRGGNFLISQTRAEETSIPPPLVRQSIHCLSPPLARISPGPISSSRSLAEHTYDRALSRRNKLLISACRN